MKQSEKKRLKTNAIQAIGDISNQYDETKARAVKLAKKFSPTSAESCREICELVWWLIAESAFVDAERILDVLCEIDDEYYWMFHSQASTFATRAYLHNRLKNTTASKNDSKSALAWLQRDPNFEPITKSEVDGALSRFDDWLERADNENGRITALHVLSHACRVLVMYQQFAKAGDAAAKSISARDYTKKITSATNRISKLLSQTNAT